MALYHLSVKPVSRSGGRSAVAAAAYRTAETLHDARQGVTHDYERKRGVEARMLLMPHSGGVATFEGDGWTAERERLWNAAEAAEKRRDARVAREYELALPCELDAHGRRRLVMAFAGELARRHGVAVDAAIHAPGREGDQRNWHAHVLATTRRAEAGSLGEKAGIELSDTARAKLGLGRAADEIEGLRAVWGGLVNRALEQARVSERVDHRSYARQGRGALTPMQHAGPAVSGMERKAERRRMQAEARQEQGGAGEAPERVREAPAAAERPEAASVALDRLREGHGGPQEAARAVPASVDASSEPAQGQRVSQAAQQGRGRPGMAQEGVEPGWAVSPAGSRLDRPVEASAGVFGAGAEPVTRVGQRNAEIQARNRAVEAARMALDRARQVLERLRQQVRRQVLGVALGLGRQAAAEREEREREAERQRQERAQAVLRAERERVAAEQRRQEAEQARLTVTQAQRDAARTRSREVWGGVEETGRELRARDARKAGRQQAVERESQDEREGPSLGM